MIDSRFLDCGIRTSPFILTNELGKVTRWTYDEFKRVTSMIDPLNRTNLYSYDFVLPGGGG